MRSYFGTFFFSCFSPIVLYVKIFDKACLFTFISSTEAKVMLPRYLGTLSRCQPNAYYRSLIETQKTKCAIILEVLHVRHPRNLAFSCIVGIW